MKILLIEDDPRISGFIDRGLTQEGMRVEIARDGSRGLKRALSGEHEVVLLDLLLPALDGERVLTELRLRQAGVPVLVLSALDGMEERVRVLNEGADDFLAKPFCFDELVARVRALARRPPRLQPDVLEVADLRVDLRSRRVQRAGRTLSLTAKEFLLLRYLLKHRDAVVTRTMIAENVWQQHFGSFSNVIDVYVRYLRAKVDGEGELKLIHTARGMGYMLSASPP